MNKHIFIDLDETLIMGVYMHGLQAKAPWTQWKDYAALLRPGALEFLAKMRTLGSVYMLTAATGDYARAWNKEFGLGFADDDIYSRDDTDGGWTLDKPKGVCYLVDDLAMSSPNSRRKIQFLRGIGETKYFRIRQFVGQSSQGITPEMITEIEKFIAE